ncbi:hypothetical protein Pint_21990 [Pistacia integerrima]|uniref:Uncharacterized protein n=1 Tax=Pistacia integerrima TaxID=434235 RepID=A0ACC0YJ13_9ROSI|nr:hypothetical protein Pint_21990 [Pistacia integerrima]
METKFLFSGICYSNLPKPESEGRTLSEVSECENIPITDLDSGDACKCYSFLQVID